MKDMSELELLGDFKTEIPKLQAEMDLRSRVADSSRRAVHDMLCDALEAAATRFADIADLMDAPEGYRDSVFLRASAERYRAVVSVARDAYSG